MAQTPIFYRIGKPFITLVSVESTNNYAMGLITKGIATHGTIVYTENQTKGRGQRDKEWLSAPGESLTFSIILRPEGIFQQNSFSVIATTAISCYKMLKKYLPEGLSVKWPNDLYYADKKAGGILIESRMRNNLAEWMVVGIGINLNQPEEKLLTTATSIKKETGKPIHVKDFAMELIETLNDDFQYVFENQQEGFLEVYNRLLYCRNKKATLIYRGQSFETIIRKVTNNGELITGHGKFIQGDVQWKAL